MSASTQKEAFARQGRKQGRILARAPMHQEGKCARAAAIFARVRTIIKANDHAGKHGGTRPNKSRARTRAWTLHPCPHRRCTPASQRLAGARVRGSRIALQSLKNRMLKNRIRAGAHRRAPGGRAPSGMRGASSCRDPASTLSHTQSRFPQTPTDTHTVPLRARPIEADFFTYFPRTQAISSQGLFRAKRGGIGTQTTHIGLTNTNRPHNR
jgi:hypothetical protein